MPTHRISVFVLASSLIVGAQEPATSPPGIPVPPPKVNNSAAAAEPEADGTAVENDRPVSNARRNQAAAPATTPQPAAPQPAALPRAAAGQPPVNPIAQAAANNLGATKIVEDIVEPKLSGNALAALYQKYTGRRVIVATAASQAEFSFIQEASPQNPLTYADAAELLRIAATIENFIFVPSDQNPNWDILTLATAGLRPTSRGVEVFNENDPLPEGDAVISYVMSLDYAKPEEAVATFTQVIGQFGAYGSIAPVPNAAAVVITENTSLIRKLIDLKAEIDVPSSKVATRFIKVQYADVTEVATTLTELLSSQQSSQGSGAVRRSNQPPVPGAQTAGATTSGVETPVQILPEPRTNRIFAMGRPVDLLFVEGLVREFDVPTSDKTFLRQKLRFLTVSEFLPIAGEAITRAFSGSGEGGSAGGRTTGGGRSTPSQTQNTRNASSGFNASRNSSSRGSSGFGGGSSGIGGGSGASLGDPQVNSAPESMLVGRTLLVADNITNSIVVQGPPSALEIVQRLLDQLDVKPDQVMISTVIGQLTLNGSESFGADYLFLGGDVASGAGGGLGGLLPILPILGDGDGVGNGNGLGLDYNPAPLSGSGLRVFGSVGDMRIYIEALKSKTDFTVLSRPSIFTANNQKGTISSGERIAIPTNSNSFSNGGASTNIEYQDVVLKLEVIPLVNSNDEITMQIALLSDEQNGVQVLAGAGSNGDDLEVPRISTREILTTATVPNKQTIVLGGLIVGRANETKSGVPILGDIPVVGSLFSRTSTEKDRSELMIFIQPSIVNSTRSLDDVQYDMDNRFRISPSAHSFADGSGLLPGENDQETNADKAGTEPTRYPSATDSKPRANLRPIHRR